MQVPVEKQFHKSLIGSGGKVVGRLESDYDVKIDFSDVVKIKGTPMNVEAAQQEIMELIEFEVVQD